MNILELHKYYNQATYDKVRKFLMLPDINFGSHILRQHDDEYFAIQDFFFNELARYEGCAMTKDTHYQLTYLWNSFIESLRRSDYFLMLGEARITKIGVSFGANSVTLVPFFDELQAKV